ncbi:phosphatase PAP2 family protein [Acetobacter fallax]|uniref:Phosphatase PAP2 family protein n=1 Tax=Acetobacter fallax TaxID=1737473 RepID=A0ABX0K3P9_9PROT|nr:phosphatase PAP2 family protein [Acetobacter fallax]NHO30964.1 phosphatase PAP2 family protein [Acetobacter fallax]NHO34521.1 phosphatase PAP2 family protein [Acetobacter fallax]
MIGTFTDFADQGVLIPVEILVFLSLFLSGRKRDATTWGLAMLSGSIVIVALKLWFERCGVPHHRIIYSPSGHSMGGTMVYGGLLALFCRRNLIFLVGTVLLAVAFAGSRVILGKHTVPEAIAGALVGLIVVFALRSALAGRKEPARSRAAVPVTLILVGLIGVGLHGDRLAAEAWIQVAAQRILGSVLCH